MPIGRLFVANRGEIALRIVQAARALGMETVVAVSQADRGSLAAKEADRALVIGPPPARLSYLNANALIHAAIASGCDALHPGYGFLSERAEFAQLCEEQNLIFVGPRAETIRAVGDKLGARALATQAGLPMTPGSPGLKSVAEALEWAEELGFPVISKASSGGGGRGMRIARDKDELRRTFEQSVVEAKEAFGDGTLYLESFVENARHVEVQVLGDGLGGMLHFGERDCTLQRRYQKMMEEAPATALKGEVRERLHRCAIDLLTPIKYRNAGTVEFLYDPSRESFYFMEVNSRIQVEHPVSEMITGVDLVSMQLGVASEGCLPLTQEEIRPNGHAIELRILAEDPRRDFLPNPGRIAVWEVPQNEPEVRLDSAMHVGAMVSPYYDSMIGKLIVHGSDRTDAINRLQRVLAKTRIEGIASNLELLRFICAHPGIRANEYHTRWAEGVLMPEYMAHSMNRETHGSRTYS
jgi:acetyl-CoA carboxylase biotin carboxylase subunit